MYRVLLQDYRFGMVEFPNVSRRHIVERGGDRNGRVEINEQRYNGEIPSNTKGKEFLYPTANQYYIQPV